jgi:putative RecB family exonuclease
VSTDHHHHLRVIPSQEPANDTQPRFVLTPSKLVSYIQCPKRFSFQYIERVPETTVSSAVVFGKAMHTVLEIFHRAAAARGIVCTQMLMRCFTIEFESEVSKREVVIYRPQETFVRLQREANGLLHAYRSAGLIATITGVEQAFEAPSPLNVAGETVPTWLRGRMDLVLAGDTIVEFKTSMRQTDIQSLENNIQLLAYAAAYRSLHGVTPAIRVITFVRGETPLVDFHSVIPSEMQLDRFWDVLEDVRSKIESGWYPKNVSKLCGYCPFEKLCQPNEDPSASMQAKPH